jgi:hypothetical protein
VRSLLTVEVRRFRSRRAVVVLGGAVLLALIVGSSLTFALSNRDIAGATAKLRAHATAEYQACLRDTTSPPGESFGENGKCGEPDLASITRDPRFDLTKLPEILAAVSGLLIMIGLGLGASFVGAEWHHRTMALTLTWEPRRIRVALAKIAAAAACTMVGVAVIELLLSAALLPAAFFRGSTGGVDASWLAHTFSVGIRGAAAVGIAASLGAALAFLARNTAFALGVCFVWIAVLEGFVRQGKPGWARWMLGDNTAGFIAGGADAPRTGLASGILLGLYAAGMAWMAAGTFARRDVA